MAIEEVPRGATQPAGLDLASPEEVCQRLQVLEATGRAKFGVAGCSREGREIPYVVLTSRENIVRLDEFQSLLQEASVPLVWHETLDHVVVRRRLEAGLTALPVPILFTGGSFGFEASLTEGLLQVAERLATSGEDAVQDLLQRELVIIAPMTNPDGTARANAEWSATPTSCGWSGCGNSYGLLQNRDFMNLTQPETQAIARLWREWTPFVHYDPQEDIVMLGVTNEAVCWCPPYRAGTYPTLLPPALNEMVALFGERIARRWQEEGYVVLYDPSGEHGFLPVVGELGARCAVTAMFRDVVGLETESARTPGTQTWEDRNRQKVLAAMTILETVNAERDALVDRVLSTRNSVNTDDKGAFIIPLDQHDRGLLRALLEAFMRHGIAVYSAACPLPAYVVPLSQPRPYLIRFLLSDWPGMPAGCLAPEYGVRVTRIEDLGEADQRRWRTASLKRVTDVSEGCVRFVGGATKSSTERPLYALPPTVTHTRLVMRLLPRVPVRRATRASRSASAQLEAGTFLVEGMAESELRRYAKGYGRVALEPDVTKLPSDARLESIEVRLPRVGIYGGQGCSHDYTEYIGAVRFGLDLLEIPYVELTARDLRGVRSLDNLDILIVPNGDARQIVGGLEANPTYSSRPPWSLSEESKGIGDSGMDAIRSFVRGGGRYIGFELGGGTLAGRSYLGLIDIDVAAVRCVSSGPVRLTKRNVTSPVFYGYPPSQSEAGETEPEAIWAHFTEIPSWYLQPGRLAPGPAPVFASGGNVAVLAEIGESKSPAILTASYGRGEVVIFAVAAGFRGIWIGTTLLLANAILAAPHTLAP